MIEAILRISQNGLVIIVFGRKTPNVFQKAYFQILGPDRTQFTPLLVLFMSKFCLCHIMNSHNSLTVDEPDEAKCQTLEAKELSEVFAK